MSNGEVKPGVPEPCGEAWQAVRSHFSIRHSVFSIHHLLPEARRRLKLGGIRCDPERRWVGLWISFGAPRDAGAPGQTRADARSAGGPPQTMDTTT